MLGKDMDNDEEVVEDDSVDNSSGFVDDSRVVTLKNIPNLMLLREGKALVNRV
jgi:hypothetical protein